MHQHKPEIFGQGVKQTCLLIQDKVGCEIVIKDYLKKNRKSKQNTIQMSNALDTIKVNFFAFIIIMIC